MQWSHLAFIAELTDVQKQTKILNYQNGQTILEQVNEIQPGWKIDDPRIFFTNLIFKVEFKMKKLPGDSEETEKPWKLILEQRKEFKQRKLDELYVFWKYSWMSIARIFIWELYYFQK